MKPVLFVDLDESLIRTDILREQLARSLALSFWVTLKIVFRERFRPEGIKAELGKKIPVDPATLPYNQAVLELIHQAKQQGHPVVLATATHEHVAHQIAQYLGIFDAVLATDKTYNCKGKNKLAVMQKYAGNRPFDYVGDSSADLEIYPYTRTAYIVGKMAYAQPHQRISSPSSFLPFLQALRPAHWAKNILVFLPLFTSHTLGFSSLIKATTGFASFCLAASAIYIINDMVDVEDDRHHPQKKNRPFARGDLTIDQGFRLCFLLLGTAILISCWLLPAGLWILGGYIGLTFLYSFSFKSQAILDVFCLSTLYTIRVLYGQVINNIPSSSWLLAFCIFFFLSLAFVKRTAEIKKIQLKEQSLPQRRGYLEEDYRLTQVAGISSGLISILVLGLYINSDKVIQLYPHPEFLWGACYVLLYWKLRLWLIATRGQMNHDPIVFALRDQISYLTGGIVIVFAIIAKGIF